MSMITREHVGRRLFLKAALTGAVTTAWGWGDTRARADITGQNRSLRAVKNVQEHIRGPILSLPTPFTDTFEVDYEGVRRMVRGALDQGVRVFSLTPGNSYYHSLSYGEIKELTRVMVEAVDGRGVTIAATGGWWTDRASDYAAYAESVGADALQVSIPTRTDMASQVEHFRAVSKATRLGIVVHGVAPVALLEELIDIDHVIAMKEDTTLADYIERQRRFGDRLVIYAGGPKYRFLVAQPYGSRAFYSLYSTFAPQIPMRFWKAVQADDLTTAYDIVKKYEFPFFDRWSHAFWRASLEHFGVAQRYLRPPEKSFTAEQMQEVGRFFEGLGLRPTA